MQHLYKNAPLLCPPIKLDFHGTFLLKIIVWLENVIFSKSTVTFDLEQIYPNLM